MHWLIAWHVIFMVAWFAGLFYLPRLYVYHSAASDQISLERFVVMEKKLYYYIMTPAAVLTSVTGLWLLFLRWQHFMSQSWMIAKLLLVVVLWAFHLSCGHLYRQFYRGQNQFSHRFYRFFNEVPTILLISIVILVFVKP